MQPTETDSDVTMILELSQGGIFKWSMLKVEEKRMFNIYSQVGGFGRNSDVVRFSGATIERK